jgi:hypothetical protein
MRADVRKRLPGDHTSAGTGVDRTFKREAVMLDVSNTTIVKFYLPCFVVTVNIKIHRPVTLSIVYRLLYVDVTTGMLLEETRNSKWMYNML